MQRSDVREAMRRRRTQLRAMLPRFREVARARVARLEQIPAFKAAREALARRRRRRRRIAGAMTLLLLLLLLVDCEGKPGKHGPAAKATPIAKVTPKPKPTPRGPIDGKLATQKRPGYTLDARPGPDWLDDFRLQVAARSPRLAQCFNGSERGGTLRWTTSVDAKTGVVSDHDFEPLGASANMGGKQATCVAHALSDPPYLLKNPPPDALPNRVSLILEF